MAQLSEAVVVPFWVRVTKATMSTTLGNIYWGGKYMAAKLGNLKKNGEIRKLLPDGQQFQLPSGGQRMAWSLAHQVVEGPPWFLEGKEGKLLENMPVSVLSRLLSPA